MYLSLGLKTAIAADQFYDRFVENPDIIEFHLNEEDLFGERRNLLRKRIEQCLKQGIKVFLHHPIRFKGEHLNIINESKIHKTYYRLSTLLLIEMCKEYEIQCVVHPHYSNGLVVNSPMFDKLVEKLKENIKFYESISNGCILWENSTLGIFSLENEKLFEDIVKPLNLNICFDVSHAFISFKGSNDKLLKSLEKFKKHIKYFHIVDSEGEVHDSLELGKGLIHWEGVKSYTKNIPYIFEIDLDVINDCSPMVRSYNYFRKIKNN